MNQIRSVDAAHAVAVHALYIMNGYSEVAAGGSEPSELQERVGHIGVADAIASVAAVVGEYLAAQDISALGEHHPGVFEYEILEPLGKWLHWNSKCTCEEFRAELDRRFRAWVADEHLEALDGQMELARNAVNAVNAKLDERVRGWQRSGQLHLPRRPHRQGFLRQGSSDPKGPGRRAGQFLEPLAKAGDRLLGAPYAASRWASRYEQALQPRMASVILAIDIARLGSSQERQAKAFLLKLALGHAENLLKREREDVDSGGFGLMLALSAVEAMSSEPCEDLRPRWLGDQGMEALGRAVAIWSQPALALAEQAQARQMFLLATQASIHRPHSSRLTRALNLLDMAFATMQQANSAQGFALLGSTWQAALADGRIPGAQQYVDAFDVLTRAAGSPEDAPLSNNMTWRTSRTAFALAAAKSQPPTPATSHLSAGASREAPPTSTEPRGGH